MNCPCCGRTMAKKLIDQWYCVFCAAVVTVKEVIGNPIAAATQNVGLQIVRPRVTVAYPPIV